MNNECSFCNLNNDRILFSGDDFIIVKDLYPVSPGHLLIISKRHCDNYFSLNNKEKKSLIKLISTVKNIIEKDNKPDGYNVGMNCGLSAGQTIMHFHCHIIPRYHGDIDNPKGGIRNIFPGKGEY